MKKLILVALMSCTLFSCDQKCITQPKDCYNVYIITDSDCKKKTIDYSKSIVVSKGDHLLITGDYHDANEWYVVTTNSNGIFAEQRYLRGRLSLKFFPYHDLFCDKGFKNLTR